MATHGRSLWILEVSALRQMKPEVLAKSIHLFKPPATTRWQSVVKMGGTNRKFVGTNPQPGAPISFFLADEAKKVTVKIVGVDGELISTLTPKAEMGMNVIRWNMAKGDAAGDAGGMGAKGGKGGKGGGGFGGPGGFGGGKGGGGFAGVPAGVYRVVLSVDGVESITTVRIEADPNVPARPNAGEDEELPFDPRKVR